MVLDDVEDKLHVFLTSVLDGGEWSTSLCSRSAPREDSTIFVRRLGRFTASLDMVTKIKHPAANRTPVCEPFSSLINLSRIREMKFCNTNDTSDSGCSSDRLASQPDEELHQPTNHSNVPQLLGYLLGGQLVALCCSFL
jgi:hypothetical protein